MINCLIGTRAQLIKMAPVLREIEARGIAYRLVFSGQHKATMRSLLEEFGVVTEPDYLYDGPEISGIAQMGLWLVRVLLRGVTTRRALFSTTGRGPHAMLVHGDTFSTLLGALFGRIFGYEVLHVESGLTSGRLLEPFPEEFTRRLVFRLANTGFCPGQWACGNLSRYSLTAIDTGTNTIVDAVRLAAGSAADDTAERDKPYAVVSLHRFENIFRRERLEFIVSTLTGIAARIRLIFVLHPATESQLRKHGLIEQLKSNANIELVPRMTYLPFMRLLLPANFVVTDGGSNQEELAVLKKPTLLMRGATERQEGLGETAVLSRYDVPTIERFVEQHVAAHPDGTLFNSPESVSPSSAIADELERYQEKRL